MSTTNQPIGMGDEYVEITDAVSSGLFSIIANTQFATGDSQPDKSLVGHLLSTGAPRRYNITSPKKLYVKQSPSENIIVVVDED